MIGLDQATSSYVILSGNVPQMESFLYGSGYSVTNIKEFYNGKYSDSLISYGMVDNDNLRKDVLFMLNNFNSDFAIIKYMGESVIRRINRDGTESPLDLIMYNTDSDKVSYLYNGYSFSFNEKKRYYFPSKKEDIKINMVVEFFNNNKWIEKKVSNPDVEYENMYKLLIKYNKLRIPV